MPGVDVARVLRGARDLMNTNGRHWIKGDMVREVDETLIEWRDNNNGSGVIVSPKAQVGDVAYCAWGGIAEIADDLELRVEAMEALVQIIDPQGYSYYEDEQNEEYENWKVEFEYSKQNSDSWYATRYPTFGHLYAEQLDSREEILGDRIATWNDDDKRTWAEVRDSLTKAAAKAKRK